MDELGLKGLPQGVGPSAPLGNLYLRPLDGLLAEAGVRYVRWMDDFVIAAGSYAHAREVLDTIERRLYGIGLTLAADKSKIRPYERAYADSEDAGDRLQRIKTARQVEATSWVRDAARWMDYPPNEVELPNPSTLDRDVVIEVYDELLSHVDDDDLPKGFQADVVATLRELEALKEGRNIGRIPRLLTRAADLTGNVLRYAASVAKTSREAECVDAFTTLLTQERFMREAEKLDLCAAVLALSSRAGMEQLADPLGEWALQDRHPLIRARALIAWGAQSSDTDFTVADNRFWSTAGSLCQPYALIAIQTKNVGLRDERYAKWGGTGEFLGRLAELLRNNAIGWRKL